MAEKTITTTRKGRFHLAKIIGFRYRFDLDEAWFHELAENRELDRLWYEQILAPKIHISASTRSDLWFSSSTPPGRRTPRKIHEAIKDQPGFIKADFAFDGEAELYFTKEALPTVAELAGARKKRQLSRNKKRNWQNEVQLPGLNLRLTV